MDLRTQQVIQGVVKIAPSKTIPELQAEFQAWANGRLVDRHDHVVSDLKRELISRCLGRGMHSIKTNGFHPQEYVFRKFLLPREVFCFPEHAPAPITKNNRSEFGYSYTSEQPHQG